MGRASEALRILIILETGNPETAAPLAKALIPETHSQADLKRGKTTISCEEDKVIISIEARDVSSLRALLNAYAYLLESLRKLVASET